MYMFSVAPLKLVEKKCWSEIYCSCMLWNKDIMGGKIVSEVVLFSEILVVSLYIELREFLNYLNRLKGLLSSR